MCLPNTSLLLKKKLGTDVDGYMETEVSGGFQSHDLGTFDLQV